MEMLAVSNSIGFLKTLDLMQNDAIISLRDSLVLSRSFFGDEEEEKY